MRIDNNNLSIQRINPVRAKNVRHTEGAADETDAVTLSRRAADIQAALEALQEVPEVREDQVAQFKAQLAQGTFPVDEEALAQKLLGRPSDPSQ